MSVESALRDNGLTQIDLRVLSVINDLTLATISQVRGITGIPESILRGSFRRLSESLIERFGFPSLHKAHPLSGSYYGCVRSDLGRFLLPGRYRWTRIAYSRSASRTHDAHGLYFKSSKDVSKVFYFSNHSAMVNYSAAWILSMLRQKLGWDLAFEGEQIIRHERKWHYGRIVTLADKSAGIAMSVPDFLLIRDGKILCCEVELTLKSRRVYEAYYDHLDPSFSVLYLVPSLGVAKRLFTYLPRTENVDYSIITDSDTMLRAIQALFPA